MKSAFISLQKWLDYYGPFEAVVDAANIGLYSQRKFKPSKASTLLYDMVYIYVCIMVLVSVFYYESIC